MIPPDIERVALLGWHVYPGSATTRAGCFEGAHDAASCDLDTIASWCRDYPRCSWRLVCGPSRVWGLDLDVPPMHRHDGIAAFTAVTGQHEPLPKRPTLRSGGGGLAIFFRHDGEPIAAEGKKLGAGIDPRRGRQSQTIPPSLHYHTRQPYRWLTPPWEVAPPPAPAWLLALLAPPPEPPARPAPKLLQGDGARNYAVAVLHNAIRRAAAAGQGDRNNSLNQQTYGVARFIADGMLSEAEVRDSMMAAARAAAIPLREAMATIDSALKSRRARG